MWIWWPQAFKQINCLKHGNISLHAHPLPPSTSLFIIHMRARCVEVYAVKKNDKKILNLGERMLGKWMNVNERVRANVRFFYDVLYTFEIISIMLKSTKALQLNVLYCILFGFYSE